MFAISSEDHFICPVGISPKSKYYSYFLNSLLSLIVVNKRNHPQKNFDKFTYGYGQSKQLTAMALKKVLGKIPPQQKQVIFIVNLLKRSFKQKDIKVIDISNTIYEDSTYFSKTIFNLNEYITYLKPINSIDLLIELMKYGNEYKDYIINLISPDLYLDLTRERFNNKKEPIGKGTGNRLGNVFGIIEEFTGKNYGNFEGKTGYIALYNTTIVNHEVIKNSAGVIIPTGGFANHIAIITSQMSKPSITGVTWVNPPTATVSIDSFSGEIFDGILPLIPSPYTSIAKTINNWTKGYQSLKIMGIADSPEQVELTLHAGATGIGLFRTEYMFKDKAIAKTIREVLKNDATTSMLQRIYNYQFNIFKKIYKTAKDKDIVIRLFDAPIGEFLEEHDESNPMMGLRGIRYLLHNKKFLMSQVNAILDAAISNNTSNIYILLPMVTYKEEIDETRKIIKESIGKRKINYKLGVMLETPAACLIADTLNADFYSIGTNDLTQFTLACSRDDSNYLNTYNQLGISDINPFVTLDASVKNIIDKIRVDNPKQLSVCGRHASDVNSLRYFISKHVSSVSVELSNINITQLIAAQTYNRELPNFKVPNFPKLVSKRLDEITNVDLLNYIFLGYNGFTSATTQFNFEKYTIEQLAYLFYLSVRLNSPFSKKIFNLLRESFIAIMKEIFKDEIISASTWGLGYLKQEVCIETKFGGKHYTNLKIRKKIKGLTPAQIVEKIDKTYNNANLQVMNTCSSYTLNDFLNYFKQWQKFNQDVWNFKPLWCGPAWTTACGLLIQLKEADENEGILILDALNDLAHQTGLLLTRINMYWGWYKTFILNKARFTTVQEFLPFIPSEARGYFLKNGMVIVSTTKAKGLNP